MSTAIPTVYVAVDTAIQEDAAIMAILMGVWASGDVPPNQPISDGGARVGYVELGTSRETAADMFATDGNDDGLRVTVRATSKYTAAQIYRHLHRILHNKPLPAAVMNPDSQGFVESSLVFIEDFPNPDGGYSAVGDYAVSVVSLA